MAQHDKPVSVTLQQAIRKEDHVIAHHGIQRWQEIVSQHNTFKQSLVCSTKVLETSGVSCLRDRLFKEAAYVGACPITLFSLRAMATSAVSLRVAQHAICTIKSYTGRD